MFVKNLFFNTLNAELNPIFHLLALLGAHHILHISRIRVKYKCCVCVQLPDIISVFSFITLFTIFYVLYFMHDAQAVCQISHTAVYSLLVFAIRLNNTENFCVTRFLQKYFINVSDILFKAVSRS
jgi:hypothetical protein